MKHISIVVLMSTAVALSAACTKTAPAPSADDTAAVDGKVQYLLVQTAPSVRYGNGALVLESVHDQTLYFSDRPNRIAGWLPTREQIEDWGVGEDNFASDPPNAALSILSGDNVQEIVVVLTNPRLIRGDLVYDVEILEGEMPAAGGPSSLFIDIVGAPLTPVSAAGVSRRTSRRVARRY